jgi:hypothetical protein
VRPRTRLHPVLTAQRFRFLSIDGGHSRDTVYSDLTFAECQLADGGIASMDDYSHAYWPGVHEGITTYFNHHPDSRLAPFLLAHNKVGGLQSLRVAVAVAVRACCTLPCNCVLNLPTY